MKLAEGVLQKRKSLIASLENDRQPWWPHWRDLADYILPKRYDWLLNSQERRTRMSKNPNIIDGTGTQAVRTASAGLMNGKTSPSRQWFKLRVAGFKDDTNTEVGIWLDEVERRMMLVMAESNFYNSLAVMYLDILVFGTAAMLIYEDYEDVIRCYNSSIGEFYLGQNDRLEVCIFSRSFTQKVWQVVRRWGEDNCSERVRDAYTSGGSRLNEDVDIVHLIEPNDDRSGQLPGGFDYREFYWEKSCQDPDTVLQVKGFYEMPGLFPRWELTGNDAYGTSPGMDALGDIIQLQHESKRKAQVLDYSVRPPTLSDISLQGRPTALLPGQNTYVANLANNAGVRPVYQMNPNIREISEDIREVQARIKETFYNDLFKRILQLDTVRSATEIQGIEGEKLTLLGPVIERLDNEALDKGVNRVYEIMNRAGLIPPPPQSIQGAQMEVQYVSILNVAQTAAGVAPTERFLQLVGNISPVFPEARDLPDVDQILRNYGRNIGMKSNEIKSADLVTELRAEKARQIQAAQAAEQAQKLAEAGKNLSQTDVGGGQNAVQALIGG